MGVRLVVAALEPTWAGVSERARLLLVHMAMRALDRDTAEQQAAQYFAGHGEIARFLWGTDDITANHLKMVQRAIVELKNVGAISVLRPGMNGRPPCYKLNLTPNQEALI